MFKKVLSLAFTVFLCGVFIVYNYNMALANEPDVNKSNSTTEIIFLLDCSGSMYGLEEDTIGGFNSFVKKQSEIGPTTITTILFDDKYEILHNNLDASNVVLTKEEYQTRGATALLDAIGKTINDVNTRLEKLPKSEQPTQVIFVITTDGEENSSREFTYDKISEMIKNQQEKYNWEFIFMGANIDVAKESQRLNIPTGNAVRYEASSAGTADMFLEVENKVNATRNKNNN